VGVVGCVEIGLDLLIADGPRLAILTDVGRGDEVVAIDAPRRNSVVKLVAWA
jgi:hypothetical protein